MRYICSQCGKEIPADSDFCYACGAMKDKALTLDEGGGESTAMTCHKCGEPLTGNENVCPKCGTPLVRDIPEAVRKKALLALFLALVPGFFNIFGLGHILLKQYMRGGMFLVISGVLWLIYPGYTLAPSFAIMFIRIIAFMYQLFDLYRVIYSSGEQRRWTGPRSTGPRTSTACSGTRRRSTPSGRGPGHGSTASPRCAPWSSWVLPG